MLSDKINTQLDCIVSIASQICERGQQQCFSLAELTRLIVTEVEQTHELLKQLEQRDWPDKAYALPIAHTRLTIAQQSGLTSLQLLSGNQKIILAQLEMMVAGVGEAKRLAQEPGEPKLPLILSALGLVLAAASTYVTANPTFTMVGLSTAIAGFLDTVARSKSEIERVAERENRNVADDEARVLFRSVQETLQVLYDLVCQGNQAFMPIEEFPIVTGLCRTRTNLAEAAGME